MYEILGSKMMMLKVTESELDSEAEPVRVTVYRLSSEARDE
jgi:hypothetical protein